MKKVLFSLSLLLASSASFAQIADGYYRLKSATTERYAVVMDNRGSVDVAATSVDLGAIHSFKDYEGNIVSNPGSIIYAKSGGDGYDLQSQAASTYSMVGYYIQIRESRNTEGAYWAYGSKSGQTIYIADSNTSGEEGILVDNGGRHDWYILPVETEGDNYFGVRPSVEVGGKYYQPFYAAFPFTFHSNGMKAYYVSKFGGDMAVIKEYTGGELPKSMPMIIECGAAEPTDNRLNLLVSSSAAAASDNILSGTYFNNSWPSNHRNRVTNDPATIRMLGVTSTGELGMVAKPDVDYVPANTAYLVVPEGTPSELRLVDEDEFEATVGITEVETETKTEAMGGVYTLAGVKVAEGTTLPSNLPSGVYIVGGKKVVVKN